jgi:hypothetical protein
MNHAPSGFCLAFLAIGLLTVFAACSSPTMPPATVNAENSPTRKPTLTAPTAAVYAGKAFQNPVLRENFPNYGDSW